MSNFDESTFGLSPRISNEDVDDLDVDSLDIDDDGTSPDGVQADGEAQESRPSDKDEATRRPHTVAIGWTGKKQVRRISSPLRTRVERDERRK
ncbi:hypothetical protein Pcac1_g28789 [Phytophthora cactorum]|nr:hypothetical protein Pcac1_g28789 [Phytophthora cactorum]